MAEFAKLPVSNKVASPTAPVVTPTGGAAGAYSYAIVGVDANGQRSQLSPAGSTSVGPTTLGLANFNTVTWTDPVGAATIELFVQAGTNGFGLLATIAAGVQTYTDNGSATPDGELAAAPTVTPTGGAAGAYSYEVVGVDASGNEFANSLAGATAVGPTTLSAINFNTVTWTDPTDVAVVAVRVYRVTGGATQGLIATVGLGVGTLADKALVGNGASPAFATNASGFGSFVVVDLFDDLVYQVSGTFVATLQPQGSLDGVTWFNDGAAISSATLRTAAIESYVFFRMVMTSYTSGTVQAFVAGHRET